MHTCILLAIEVQNREINCKISFSIDQNYCGNNANQENDNNPIIKIVLVSWYC